MEGVTVDGGAGQVVTEFCMGIWRWLHKIFAPAKSPNDFALDTPLPWEGPRHCPHCLGRLAAVEVGGVTEYVCQGWADKDEAAAILLSEVKVPQGFLSHVGAKPPCGFSGKGADYGVMWA